MGLKEGEGKEEGVWRRGGEERGGKRETLEREI